MWFRSPLDDLLSSPAKVAVLRVLTTVGAPLSGREIARQAGLWPASASKALNELTASGVLWRQDHGRAKTYVLDQTEVKLVAGLKELFWTEGERYGQVVDDLVAGIPEAMSLLLFGSEARGEARPGSDTDVMIVVAKRTLRLEEKVLKVCMAVEQRHGLSLSWHVADLADLRDWIAEDDPFWRNVRAQGVVLHGNTLEGLERQCRVGKAS